MTTNQTIDGVPRARIQEIISDIERGGRLTAVEKLRALMDAPVCGACNGSGWIDNLRPVGTQAMNCPDCKPAAQITNAQSRAADYKEQQAFNDWAWNKEGEAVGRMDGQAAAIEAWHARAKLAEQPAPVAVVLPGEKPEARAWGHDMGGNYAEGHADGWNACLDELKRLNPSL
ncbi:hypothetical protein QIT80_gp08 (endogenous virus) [Pseudomonas phage phiAH14a]|uniref:Uncharacterized protein n=1 Tax=Pseudomonas phage phiAH14a TaxID=1805958 RepID=A0A1B0VN82_9CAUD|nr:MULTISPECIES: hypothetical protein [unclassified Pseudomonas]YP_010773025.1 hypothetical protein QIT80_gp08 [Pseudomonas phage phiAH14a]AMW64468.1 hypothetical protein AH14a_p08 [Pseudomonas phage phiAH14a]KAA0946700.1 hypothetical protein FQ182_13325 [Pseudomonas sp. ANT_H4]KAA0953199.1 hypothetical protein FQ186_06540 [Pseudomonas sp. ANT_H14]